jgi:hypothetical protein
MRYALFVLVAFLMGCASSSRLVNEEGMLNLSATEVDYVSKSDFFGQPAIERISQDNYLQQRGDYYLDLILNGYYNQVQSISVTENENEGISLRIKNVSVKHGATLNFIDPGPIYVMRMQVEVFRNGNYLKTEYYKTRVNMAEVIHPEKKLNWLTTEEKKDSQNQLETFEVGLRKLYRDIFFKHLQISLRL